MKSFKVVRDKKSVIYLSTWLFLGCITAVLMARQVNQNLIIMEVAKSAFGILIFYSLFFSFIFFVVYLKLLGKAVTVVHIGKKCIMTGIIFAKRIRLDSITSIQVEKSLQISSKRKTLKIINFCSDENLKIYNEIITALKQNKYFKLNISRNKILSQLKSSDSMNIQNGKKNKITKHFYAYICAGLYAQGYYIFNLSKELFSGEGSIYVFVGDILLFLFGLYIVYLLIKRSKKVINSTILYLYIFQCANIIFAVVNIFYSKPILDIINTILLTLVLNIMGILVVLIVHRYLKYSRNVKLVFNK